MASDVGTTERLTLSVPEAARACGISERHFRVLISQGDVPIVRVGRRVLVVRTQLAEWLARPEAHVVKRTVRTAKRMARRARRRRRT